MTTSGLLWLIFATMPGALAALITAVRAGCWLVRRALSRRQAM